MPLTPEQRVELLALSAELEGPQPGPAARRFAQEHAAALIAEIAAVPGASHVRAMALRLLPLVSSPGPERDEAMAAAGAAILQPGQPGPAALVRHPAWIGLAALELADLRPAWVDDPVERAVELAGRAFAALGGPRDLDEGEVLWAMAEQAGDAGWAGRADSLLERALEAPFAEPAHRAQVRLLVAMRREQRGEPSAHLFALVAEDEDASARDRVHASWILGHLRWSGGDAEGAVEAMALAAELVDRDEDGEVAARVDDALARWRA
jgi:hypothetical protein